MRRIRRSKRFGMWGCIRGGPTSWTARIIIVTRMSAKALAGLLVAGLLIGSAASAQSVRSRIRPKINAITPSQATELTLTVTAVTVRPVQVWVRTAGQIDPSGKVVTAYLSGSDAMLVHGGQRARTFPVESRSSMSQARVVRTTPQG